MNRLKSWSSWSKWAGPALLVAFLSIGLFVWSPRPRGTQKKTTGEERPPVHRPVLGVRTNYNFDAKRDPRQALVHSIPAVAPLQPPGTNPPPEDFFPRPVRDVAEAQIALARLGISAGSVDGLLGPQTRMAIEAFQRLHQFPETGQLDPATRDELVLTRAPLGQYTLTEPDFARLQPLSKTWAGKAQQTALDYETVLELVAERTRTQPQFLRRLNLPDVFLSPRVGATVTVPDTELGELTACEFIRIFLSRRTLEAYDSQSNLVAHFPCSIAQRVEKRPAGELHVVTVAPNPNYTFDPEMFPESAEARQLASKLVLPPGPNNPVGIAWIGLDKPGYGIHGTPSPELVGRTESHGCFRLANWNAEHLLKIIRIGTPVYVEQ